MTDKDRSTRKILIIGLFVLLIASTSGGIGYYFGAHNAQTSVQMGNMKSVPNGKKLKSMPSGKKPSSKSFNN
ncbi:hypothetical protein [Liquorilactobacillus mali]|uniref:Uncharacterized protein n=1 Tax=Liquorilactobacillus mali KCTC 3596 = DSM 20444 TaxID=1046596 RepID=J0KY63_9LACO|nr:hypothetical protein [Liquorilactobacillus mali]EJE98734.1 hypothetical protein LMA_06901 [Liquorilactobacillus mali KCTC 3596 = DSM 20444]KRN10968.1 hypothetical protein FD00_GL001858 [Liquorilactobacillus mali KCTC 3596 = DSM 20444]MDC7952061.1 hypothetical protein [Liquorilactobacillus mali]MDV7757009.1 hypothetical protein [Liquorilactobacillus mali]QFQ74845.1 hypothetical protein LM596_06835 [Liquorilactobacillus mali]